MKITESYNIFNECVNVLELIISLFLLTSKKKEWNEYIICFYGGFLFGIIPFYVIIENIPIALTGCIFLSACTIRLSWRYYQAALYLLPRQTRLLH